MLKLIQALGPIPILIVACILETSGDAVIRMAIYDRAGMARIVFLMLGAILAFGYANFVNFTPLEFGKVAGYYIAVLFVTWQVTNWIFFRAVPTLPILVGGAFIICGGLIMSLWQR